LISNSEEHKNTDAEPEIKALLDDMKRRSSVRSVRLEEVDDTLDAA
jgi:hypothetical protein